jgi:hypothetical protein
MTPVGDHFGNKKKSDSCSTASSVDSFAGNGEFYLDAVASTVIISAISVKHS